MAGKVHENAAGLFHGVDDILGVIDKPVVHRSLGPVVEILVGHDDDRFRAFAQFFLEPGQLFIRNHVHGPLEVSFGIMLTLHVIEAGIEDDVFDAAESETVVALSVRRAVVRGIHKVVRVRNLIEVVVAGDVVAGAVKSAVFVFNGFEEVQRAFAVAVVLAVLEVAQFDHKVEIAGVEQVKGLTEFGHGVSVNTDGVFVFDAADGLNAVMNISYPAKRGKELIARGNFDVLRSKGGLGESAACGGENQKTGCGGFEEGTAFHHE